MSNRHLRWCLWRIAREIGEQHGTWALDDESVMALLVLAEAAGISDEHATRAVSAGVLLGARVRRLDLFHEGEE